MFDTMRFTALSQQNPMADLIGRVLAEGGDFSAASLRSPGFRALAPLFDRAQVLVDKAVIDVGLQRLTFVADLLAEGLVTSLSDPLSVTQLEWYTRSRVGAAQRTMTPSARGENKLPAMVPNRLPVYLTTDQFELDVRTLKMSQRVGLPLDVSIVQQCTRAVNEAIEDAAINGATTIDGQALYVGGYYAPGLLNAPNANTYPIPLSWLDAAATAAMTIGPKIFVDVEAMISKLQADKKYGPFNLYVGTAYGNALDGDYKANTEGTIKNRLEMLVHGGRNLRVRTVDFMPANVVALVQMTSDVVDVVNGMPPTVIPWTSLDGFTIHNLVMAIMIPRVRSDYDGNSGICIGTAPAV